MQVDVERAPEGVTCGAGIEGIRNQDAGMIDQDAGWTERRRDLSRNHKACGGVSNVQPKRQTSAAFGGDAYNCGVGQGKVNVGDGNTAAFTGKAFGERCADATISANAGPGSVGETGSGGRYDCVSVRHCLCRRNGRLAQFASSVRWLDWIY